MGLKNIELPEIGEGVNEGELVSWLVQVGDSVEVDQSVVELMTDKATVEVPSPVAGRVKELKFEQGETVEVGQVIITLEEGPGATPGSSNGSLSASPPTPQASPSGALAPGPAPAPSPQAAPQGTPPHGPNGVNSPGPIQPPPMAMEVLATPSTRRLARESNVDINHLQGTGLAGRVTREDVLAAQGGVTEAMATPGTGGMIAPQPSPLSWQPPQAFATRGEERVPLRGIRKKIAENMQMAKRVVPHFTLMDEARVTRLMALRSELKPQAEKMGIKITYLPFVMKALMATIRDFPKFNGMIDDAAQEIVYKKDFNIGFAADTPNGLLVPVIKQADQKTIGQLSHEIMDLAQRARAGKLSLEEMKGASFTITNIGSVGGTYATPIINHPEVAIFGMYKIQERPLWVDGQWEPAHFMNFTVTCDHRLIDGAEAARFLSSFISRVESPGRLMMGMI